MRIKLTAVGETLTKEAQLKLDKWEAESELSDRINYEDLGINPPEEEELILDDDDYEKVENVAYVKYSTIDIIIASEEDEGSTVFLESGKTLVVRESVEEIEELIQEKQKRVRVSRVKRFKRWLAQKLID